MRRPDFLRIVPLTGVAVLVCACGCAQIHKANMSQRGKDPHGRSDLKKPPVNLKADTDAIRLGYFTHRQITSAMTPLQDDRVTSAVTDIGKQLVSVSPMAGREFRFHVMNDPIVNAFAAADGYVYVTTGLLDVMEDEDELAAILAHEIAHVCEHHMESHIKLAQGTKATVGIIQNAISFIPGPGVAAGLGEKVAFSAVTAAFSNMTGMVGIAVVLGYGREKELTADRLGMEYLKKSGRDPMALVRALKTVSDYEEEARAAGIPLAAKLINAEPGLVERIQLCHDPTAGMTSHDVRAFRREGDSPGD